MAITASAVTPDKTLEEFRVEFNKLIQDFEGVSSGNTFDQSIIFEGATADAYETTLLATDPTADRTITLPNVTGTVLTTANSDVGTTTTSSSDVDDEEKITNVAYLIREHIFDYVKEEAYPLCEFLDLTNIENYIRWIMAYYR